MKKLLFLALLIILTSPAWAENESRSLFFTAEQQAQIRRQRPSLRPQLASKDLLRLNGILYWDETHWSVWLNEKKWTQETAGSPNFRLLAVFPNEVRLYIKGRDGLEHSAVTLKQNQCLNLVTGEVIECPEQL